MNQITKITLGQEYRRKITGLGDIYEIISVNKKRLDLKNKFTRGSLFLSSNKDHSGRGFTLSEMKRKILETKPKRKILDFGYIDCPPWSSSPRKAGDVNKIIYYKAVLFPIKILFSFLVLWEFFWAKPKTSHMVYALLE